MHRLQDRPDFSLWAREIVSVVERRREIAASKTDDVALDRPVEPRRLPRRPRFPGQSLRRAPDSGV
jgi:hypothetical protein